MTICEYCIQPVCQKHVIFFTNSLYGLGCTNIATTTDKSYRVITHKNITLHNHNALLLCSLIHEDIR